MPKDEEVFEILLNARHARATAPFGRRALDVEPIGDLLFVLELPRVSDDGVVLWVALDGGRKALTYAGIRRYVEQLGCTVVVDADYDEEDW